MQNETNKRANRNTGKDVIAAILLLIPFIVYFDLPYFDVVNPTVAGVPFYYWFQTLWLVISAILFLIAAFLIDSNGRGV
jgi:phosphoglycerol transferase MdoB-like AlkP superfamily enzyme